MNIAALLLDHPHHGAFHIVMTKSVAVSYIAARGFVISPDRS
jgi:hypothetical protein